MPMVPREWIVWECSCGTIVNISLPFNIGIDGGGLRCPHCLRHPSVFDRRAAIQVPDLGLIGSTETAGLDYMASIANSLVDIRNMLMADHQVPRPMEPGAYADDAQITLPGMIPEKERGELPQAHEDDFMTKKCCLRARPQTMGGKVVGWGHEGACG